MAQFNVYGINSLVEQLKRLENTEEIIPKIMEDGMGVLQPAVVTEAEKHKDTGEMAASIKPTGINREGSSYYVCTRPTGTDRRGVRNMEKMAWLEYGVKGRAGTPVITKAVLSVEDKVVRVMRERFEREVGNG